MSHSATPKIRFPDLGFTRTIFLADTLVLPEDHDYSSDDDILWLTVKLDSMERIYSDSALVDLMIGRLEIGDYEVGSEPLQRIKLLHVSFPLIYGTIVVRKSIPYIINLLKAYKENISAGRMTIDRKYVFGQWYFQCFDKISHCASCIAHYSSRCTMMRWTDWASYALNEVSR